MNLSKRLKILATVLFSFAAFGLVQPDLIAQDGKKKGGGGGGGQNGGMNFTPQQNERARNALVKRFGPLLLSMELSKEDQKKAARPIQQYLMNEELLKIKINSVKNPKQKDRFKAMKTTVASNDLKAMKKAAGGQITNKFKKALAAEAKKRAENQAQNKKAKS